MQPTAPGRARSAGGGPPRSQRRFCARERVARASWSMASPACGGPGARPGVARHRPGGAEGVGEAEPDGEAEIRRLRLDPGRERRLAAEEVGAAGDVEDQRLVLLGDPGGEAPGPAPQRREEERGAARLLRPGHEVGADGASVAERHAAAEPDRLGRPGQAGQQQRAADLADDGERLLGELRLGAQRPLGGEAGEPEGKDATLRHGRLGRVCSSYVLIQGRGSRVRCRARA